MPSLDKFYNNLSKLDERANQSKSIENGLAAEKARRGSFSQEWLDSHPAPSNKAGSPINLNLPEPLHEKNLREQPLGRGDALLGGLATGITFGAGSDALRQEMPEYKNWVTAGEMLGSLIPFGVAYKGASALTKGIVNPILKAGTTGGIAGAPVGAGRAIIEGEDAQGIAKQAALYSALGAGGDMLLAGIAPLVGKGINAMRQANEMNTLRNMDLSPAPRWEPAGPEGFRGTRSGMAMEPQTMQPSLPKLNLAPQEIRQGLQQEIGLTPDVVRQPLQTLKAPDVYNQTMDELQKGIQTAQNYVKHNDILAAYPPGTTIDSALADIKSKTGVDLNALVANVEQAQQAPSLREMAMVDTETTRLGQIAGAIPVPTKLSRGTNVPPRYIGAKPETVPWIPPQLKRATRSGGIVLDPPPQQVSLPQNRPVPLAQAQQSQAMDSVPMDSGPMANVPNKTEFSLEIPVSASKGTTATPPPAGVRKNMPLPNGQKSRSFPVSVAESQVASPQVKAGVLDETVAGGRGAYEPVKLSEVDAEAKAMVAKNPEKAFKFVVDEKEPSALHTATGIRLIEAYQKMGNYERAIDVSMALAEKLTKQGQAISAARIVSALSPEGILTFAQRQIKKINANRLAPGLTKEVKLTPEDAAGLKALAEKMQQAPEGEAKIEASMELQAALNSLKPAGIGRKLATTQTVAQLLNPKTITRNVVGNELFYRLERINKYVATPIDILRSKLTGTDRSITFHTADQGGYWKAFLTGAKAGWKGVNPGGIQTQYDLGHGPAFNPNGGIVERTMSYLERTMGATLKGFDYAAYTRAKNQTLGELATLRARKVYGRSDKVTVQKVMQEMETNILDVADHYGRYVTFQDNNPISDALVAAKRAMNKPTGGEFGLGDFILKYPKTPGALLMRGLEYSPAGFLRAGYMIGKEILTGKAANSREVTLALSRAITGSLGFTGFGWFLADRGVITGQPKKDKDVRALQQASGEGAYKVNIGALVRWVKSGFNPQVLEKKPMDMMLSYDWAAPVSMSLSLGANISENIKEKQSAVSNIPSVMTGAVSGAMNTIAEQPVLKGMTGLLNSGSIGGAVARVAGDAAASFTPTLFNQVRQATDNTGRLTYNPNPVVEAINKVIYKVPGLASSLPPAYDTLGHQKEVYQDGSNNIFNVFINPAFVSRYKPSKEAQMALNVLTQTGETKHIPRVPSTYIVVDGKKVDLTPEEYSELQRIVGESTRKGFSHINKNNPPDMQLRAMIRVLDKAGKDGRNTIRRKRGFKLTK